MKKKGLMFLGAAIVAAGVTAVSFAASNTGTASISATAAPGSTSISSTLPSGANAPGINPVVGSAQSVTAGDLYFVTPGNTGDQIITVYLTNAGELAKDYSYLNLNVIVNTVATGSFNGSAATDSTSTPAASVTAQLLTINNGYVTFYVAGIASGNQYEIQVTGGTDYAVSSSTTSGASLSPSFFVTVQPGA